jgi:hypothetical protein
LDDLVKMVARDDEFARQHVGADMLIWFGRKPHEDPQGQIG